MSRRERISGRQLGALALTASGLPAFRLCCRISWLWVLIGGAAAVGTLSALTAACNRRRSRGEGGGTGRPSGLQGILAPLIAAAALVPAWQSSCAFPETAGNILAAGLVLALSAAAAAQGPAAAGRCASLLLWITGCLYGTVLLFSLPELRLRWLAPTGNFLDAGAVWAALTVPGAALCLGSALPAGDRLPYWPWPAALGTALASSLVTGGVLSPALARDPEAFRTLARGVSVLGVIRRFEALVNGALLMSGFSLCTLLLSAAETLWRRRKGDSGAKALPEKII